MAKNRKKLILKFALLFTSLVFCEILCILVFPSNAVTFDIFGHNYTEKGLPSRQVMTHDDHTYLDLVPNQQGRTQYPNNYDYEWHINSLGLRNKEEVKADHFRILVLGDSQTYGYGIKQQKTYSALLEKQLRHKTRKKIQVLNAGVYGYGTFEMLWKLRRIIDDVKPNVIVIGCFIDNWLVRDGGNDLYNNYARIYHTSKKQPKKFTTIRAFISQHFHLYTLLSKIKRGLSANRFITLINEYKKNHSSSTELKNTWQKTIDLIQQISQLGAKYQAKTLLFHIPSLQSLILQDTTVLAELQKAKLPLLDVFTALTKQLKEKSIHTMRFRDDPHYTENIHMLFAEHLSRFISDNSDFK